MNRHKKRKSKIVKKYESLKDIHIEEILKNLKFEYKFLNMNDKLRCKCFMQTSFNISNSEIQLNATKIMKHEINNHLKNICIRRAKEKLNIIYDYIFYYNFSITFKNLYSIAPMLFVYSDRVRECVDFKDVEDSNLFLKYNKNFFINCMKNSLKTKINFTGDNVELLVCDRFGFVFEKNIFSKELFSTQSHQKDISLSIAGDKIAAIYEYLFFHKIKIDKNFLYDVCYIHENLKKRYHTCEDDTVEELKKIFIELKKTKKVVKRADVLQKSRYSSSTIYKHWKKIQI